MTHFICRCRENPEENKEILEEYDKIYEKLNNRPSVKKSCQETIDEWEDWCDTHGRIPKPTSNDEEEVKLYRRVTRTVGRMRDNKSKYSDLLAEYEAYRRIYKYHIV